MIDTSDEHENNKDRIIVLIIFSPVSGTPDRIRTYDPRLRRPLLYPAELRVRNQHPYFTLK
tara:strand:+ start:194 stop:376 length:183 start_codon:yes stop_codon:yes gene_type:complete